MGYRETSFVKLLQERLSSNAARFTIHESNLSCEKLSQKVEKSSTFEKKLFMFCVLPADLT